MKHNREQALKSIQSGSILDDIFLSDLVNISQQGIPFEPKKIGYRVLIPFHDLSLSQSYNYHRLLFWRLSTILRERIIITPITGVQACLFNYKEPNLVKCQVWKLKEKGLRVSMRLPGENSPRQMRKSSTLS